MVAGGRGLKDNLGAREIFLHPITRADAFAFIQQHHRHHRVPTGGLWWHSVQDDMGLTLGVAIVGRPVARPLADGLTAEVTRLCTDGSPNVCSMLYAATRRAAQAKGYVRGLTYILESESGASLRASGWAPLWRVRGRTWSTPSRVREDKHPLENKQAWGWGDWQQKIADRNRATE